MANMNQPSQGNGPAGNNEMPPQMIVLTIRYDPQTGRMEVQWPKVGPLVNYGMLEMAKAVLDKNITVEKNEPSRILPVGVMPKLH